MNTKIETATSILANRKKIVNEFLKSKDIVSTTRETYKKSIKKFLDYLDKNKIKNPNLETIKNFKDFVLEKGSVSYCNTVMTAIKSLYKYLAKYYGIVNICEEIKSEKIDLNHKRRGLNIVQAKQLISASIEKSKRTECLVKMSLFLGTRTIELQRVNINHIIEEGGKHYIKLWRKGHKKADSKMFLPETLYTTITEYIENERKLYCKDNSEGNVPLFITEDRNPKYRGERLQTRAIRDLITSCIDTVIEDRKKEKISSHSLRRTSIGEVVRANGITVGMLHAGHSSSKVTKIYLDEEIEDEQKEKGVNSLVSLYS